MPIRPEMKARYPKDWARRSRFIREYRARRKCEWCGIPGGTPLRMRCCAQPMISDADPLRCCSCGSRVPVVVLTVAHVFDDRPEASGLLNLAALCNACHNRLDAKQRARGRRQRRLAASGQMTFIDPY